MGAVLVNEAPSFFSAIAGSRVDRAQNVLFGVSVVTSGIEAKGHGVFTDNKTLETVKARAGEFADGVRVKVNHGSGFNSIVGSLKNFRIEGEKLLADLHLLATHEMTPTILEIAESMPSSVGLSIAFSQTTEKIKGKEYARCEDLFSVDLVDRPAANPSGLFARVDSRGNGMDSKSLITKFKEFLSGVEKEIAPTDFEAKAGELETKLTAANAKITELSALQTKITELEAAKATAEADFAVKIADFNSKVEAKATEKAAAICAQLGVPPASGGGAGGEKKDFAALVASKVATDKISKASAIALCIKSNPAEYAAWRESGNTATL